MSKYDKKGKRVYTLAPEVKSWIEWQLTHYQEQRRQLAEYADEIMPSPVAAYGLNAGGGSGGERDGARGGKNSSGGGEDGGELFCGLTSC